MAIPLPTPAAVVGLTRSALDQALGSATSMAAVPARAFAVLDGVEALLARINGVVDRIETTLDRTDQVLTDAEAAVREVAVISAAATTAIDTATEVATAAAVVVAEADRVSRAAGTVVAEADRVANRAATTVGTATEAAATAAELLAAYEPALRRAAPMAGRFVEELSHEEISAAIHLIDELPKLKEHLTADILPILATLDRVGPDLHDLLDVTRDLKLAVAGIPGLGMLRRRGEKLTDEPVS
ncbi:hypothetical protein OG992_14555 [Micromonospora sp. NBC_00362]|uniref:hypothetical protein n=1 Tax=Micromonospora sp. NBC_00362 TaxID=2975975 RepID=UPI00225C3C90|nr:hypothetical protein [Micromonospora sp. NBC_00362]MCX5118407.1 hypothetical protein [Micromonospora sp. NBC_00362]